MADWIPFAIFASTVLLSFSLVVVAANIRAAAETLADAIKEAK